MESYLHTAGRCRDKVRDERGILTVYALILLLYLGGIAVISLEAYHLQQRQIYMLEEEIRLEAIIFSGLMNWEILYDLCGPGGMDMKLQDVFENLYVNILCDIEDDIFNMEIIIENLSSGRVKTYEMFYDPSPQLSDEKEG